MIDRASPSNRESIFDRALVKLIRVRYRTRYPALHCMTSVSLQAGKIHGLFLGVQSFRSTAPVCQCHSGRGHYCMLSNHPWSISCPSQVGDASTSFSVTPKSLVLPVCFPFADLCLIILTIVREPIHLGCPSLNVPGQEDAPSSHPDLSPMPTPFPTI